MVTSRLGFVTIEDYLEGVTAAPADVKGPAWLFAPAEPGRPEWELIKRTHPDNLLIASYRGVEAPPGRLGQEVHRGDS